MVKILFVIMSTAAFLSSYAFAAEIKNEAVSQKGDRVVFEFDIEGEEAETEVAYNPYH